MQNVNLSQLRQSLDNTILAYKEGRVVTTKRLHLLSEVRLHVTLDNNIPEQYQDLLTDRMMQITAYALNQANQ